MVPASFSELSRMDFNITDIACVERIWKNQWANEYPGGRDTNVLSFTAHGHKKLYVDDRENPLFSVTKPSAFFISCGAPYISRSYTDSEKEPGHTVCIKFQLTNQKGEPITVSDRYLCWKDLDDNTVGHLFSSVMEAYLAPTIDTCMLKSRLYNLLKKLISALREKEMKRGFDEIMPALQCIQGNLYAHLSVDELAKMCFISKTTFCHLFKEFSGGDSLVNYRNRMRIQKATELLQDPLWTVDMIVSALGFYDASHFYRVFKKFTGTTPVNYKSKNESI